MVIMIGYEPAATLNDTRDANKASSVFIRWFEIGEEKDDCVRNFLCLSSACWIDTARERPYKHPERLVFPGKAVVLQPPCKHQDNLTLPGNDVCPRTPL